VPSLFMVPGNIDSEPSCPVFCRHGYGSTGLSNASRGLVWLYTLITNVQISESTWLPDESAFTQARYDETSYSAGYEVDRGQLGDLIQCGVWAQDFEVRPKVPWIVGGIGAGCEERSGWRSSVIAVDRGVESQPELGGESLRLGEVVFAGEELGDDLILGEGGEG